MENSELVKHVDDNNFEAQVLKNTKPVLVDFWAPWCGPCRALGPVLEEVAREYGEKVGIVKVNVDENPETSSRYGVRSIPTIVVIRDGEVRETHVGMLPKNQIAAVLDRNLN
ncbi:MAG: Thioredoxin-1 [Syntrophaceae bacterium PtaU1.Bin231]|nr:MAG: Thioredoxin-1 [Syntrophaceae bacterium PtaU1.Bin231]HOG18264.1 thioredoxin [Syntrophales bacterium]